MAKDTGNYGVPTQQVFERTVPFLFERHYFGENRKVYQNFEVDTPENETKPDKAFVSLTKKLLESKEVAAIKSTDVAFYRFLLNTATPWRPGLWLVAVGMVERVDTRAQQWDTDRDAAVVKAKAAYPTLVEAMKEKLGPLYDPKDYPSAERFAASFYTSWRFVDMGAPSLLKTIRADVFARERAKVEAEGKKAAALIQQHLRGTLLKITDHVAKLLTVKADGKHKALRAGSLDALTAYLDTIALRDVTGDGDLQNVVKTLKGLGRGLTVDALKEDTLLRTRTAEALEAATKSLDGLVETRTRGVRFREEELV